MKRVRPPESDTESEVDEIIIGGHSSPTFSEFTAHGQPTFKTSQQSAVHDDVEVNPACYVSFDWENEGPYGKAVER